MKRYFTIILFPFLLYPVYSQNNWVDQTNNGINKNYLSPIGAIDACDSLNAVIGGDFNKMFRTTDGGAQWEMLDYSSAMFDTNNTIFDISMPDKDNIWAVTDTKIIQSSDGGSNWQVQFFNPYITRFLTYIEMFDDSNGVANGAPISDTGIPVFLKTTNGGQNWTVVNTQGIKGHSGDVWRRISFVNTSVGYFIPSAVGIQSKLYKTVDGGEHWDTTNFSQVANYIMVVKFYNEKIGFACANDGANNIICYTVDGGQNWKTSATFDYWGEDIEFIKRGDSFNVAVASANAIQFSADTGKTWTADSSLNKGGIFAISFPDIKNAWALSGYGYVNGVYHKAYDFTTGLQNLDFIPTDFVLFQNYPNPFNPSTKIRYTIPQREMVTIKIFDMLGREVSNLINEEQSAGQHEVNFKADNLPSGIYFYRINTGSSAIVKKMILLK
ncbi:MAG TPA: T9SS type A sorting domain-containing protein [Ignavibacteriaceae bacterium]|nr:T9SS type A sorting domain-containing protein [Ignavibacteriaceae bacterium]